MPSLSELHVNHERAYREHVRNCKHCIEDLNLYGGPACRMGDRLYREAQRAEDALNKYDPDWEVR